MVSPATARGGASPGGQRADPLTVATEALAARGITLGVTAAATAALAAEGYDPQFGARPLKRVIQQRIENPLSKLLLEGRYPPKSVIPVGVDPVRNPGVFEFGSPIAYD